MRRNAIHSSWDCEKRCERFSAAENLHFQRSERDLNAIQRARAGGAVRFPNLNGAGCELRNGTGRLRLPLIAVKNVETIALIIECVVHNDENSRSIHWIGIGHDDNFPVHQNS